MTNSILEITESEYLIKLNKNNFDLSFIRSLLKMVEVAKPSDGDYTSIPERYLIPSLNGSSEPEYYSYIEEK